MKTSIVLLLIMFNIFGVFAQNNSNTHMYNDTTILYIEVDELPKFQSDNFNTVLEYIYYNIKYPSLFDGQGRVIVSFVVTKCGKVEQVRIEKSLCTECDNEVKRVLLSMPKWRAGKKNNQYVNTLLFLSVNFKLQ
jgi:Periplasmic protein TonB, links inner and outer membranes